MSAGSGEGLVADRECNILEAEWLVGSARSRMDVLARLEKEEETKGGEVGRGHRQGSALVRATTLTWLTIGNGMGLMRMGGGSIRL